MKKKDPGGCALLLAFAAVCMTLTALPGCLVCHYVFDMDWPVSCLLGFLTGQFFLFTLDGVLGLGALLRRWWRGR